MLGNFTYSNPTKLYFGKDALNGLGQAVAAYTDATHGMTLAAVTRPYYKYSAEMLDGIVKSTLIMDGGYKVLSENDVREVIRASF